MIRFMKNFLLARQAGEHLHSDKAKTQTKDAVATRLWRVE
jgi:hypothetical protein